MFKKIISVQRGGSDCLQIKRGVKVVKIENELNSFGKELKR